MRFTLPIFSAALLIAPFVYAAEAPAPIASSAEVAFSPGGAEALVVKTLHGAKKSIRLAAYSFTSPAIAKELVDARKRGVDVRVVLDKSQKTASYSGLTFLVNEGVPVRINTKYAIMHNKFAVIDGAVVQSGSFNYTTSAAKRNAENVIVIPDAKVAGAYTAEWQRLWDESAP